MISTDFRKGGPVFDESRLGITNRFAAGQI
jgi:hypothetical protein